MATTLEQKIIFKSKYEGNIPHMYLDTLGFVTVGIGHLLPTIAAAKTIQWINTSGKQATEEEVSDEYAAISAMEKGKLPSFYEKQAKLRLAKVSDLMVLRDDEVTRLAVNDIAEAERGLRRKFKEFDNLPGEIQQALLDMMFNIGETKFTNKKWPKLFKAIEGRNWSEAAKQCNRPQVQAERNAAVKGLFNAVLYRNAAKRHMTENR